MNQDNSKGHPEGATPASGSDSPTVVDSIGSCSTRSLICSKFNSSSTASHDRGSLPQSTTLPPSQLATRAHIRGPTTPDTTHTTEHASATPTMRRATVAPSRPRAALPGPGSIHSVSREPLNPAPGIQPPGWQAYAPPDLPSAAAIRPPYQAQALPMEISVDAWSVPDTRAIPFAPTEPPAQGTTPSSPPALTARTLVPVVVTRHTPHPLGPTAPPVAPSPLPAGTAALATRLPQPPAPTPCYRAPPNGAPTPAPHKMRGRTPPRR